MSSGIRGSVMSKEFVWGLGIARKVTLISRCQIHERTTVFLLRSCGDTSVRQNKNIDGNCQNMQG